MPRETLCCVATNAQSVCKIVRGLKAEAEDTCSGVKGLAGLDVEIVEYIRLVLVNTPALL